MKTLMLCLITGIAMLAIGPSRVWTAQSPIAPQLPAHLDINGQTWNLVQVDKIDKNGSEGETFCDDREIDYIVTDPSDLRDTLWHEIFHAGTCIHNVDDTWWNSHHTSEEGIINLADFMHNFTRDNQQFIQWAEQN